MIQEMTPAELGKLKGSTAQGVRIAIKRGTIIPGVVSVKRFGRFYLLDVNKEEVLKHKRKRKKRIIIKK